jgi:hypothetical protein
MASEISPNSTASPPSRGNQNFKSTVPPFAHGHELKMICMILKSCYDCGTGRPASPCEDGSQEVIEKLGFLPSLELRSDAPSSL